jgi:hypothetical protein
MSFISNLITSFSILEIKSLQSECLFVIVFQEQTIENDNVFS